MTSGKSRKIVISEALQSLLTKLLTNVEQRIPVDQRIMTMYVKV